MSLFCEGSYKSFVWGFPWRIIKPMYILNGRCRYPYFNLPWLLVNANFLDYFYFLFFSERDKWCDKNITLLLRLPLKPKNSCSEFDTIAVDTEEGPAIQAPSLFLEESKAWTFTGLCNHFRDTEWLIFIIICLLLLAKSPLFSSHYRID